MKKQYVTLAMFCFITSIQVYCQQMGMGISTGVTYSNVTSKGDIGINRLPILAYSQGLSGSYSFKENWFVSIGIIDEKKGYRYQIYRTDLWGFKYGVPFFTSQEFRFLTIPVMLNFKSNSKLQYYTGLGTHLNFLIKSTYVEPLFEPLYDQNGTPLYKWNEIGQTRKLDTDNYKINTFSIAWQGGIRYPVTNNLLADFKVYVTQGVIPITKEEKNQHLKYYNRTGAVMFGILYTWKN